MATFECIFPYVNIYLWPWKNLPFTLASRLLVIVAKLFDYNCNISKLDHWPFNWCTCRCGKKYRWGLVVSFYVRLKVRLGEGLGEEWWDGLVVPSIKLSCLFNTFCVACPLIDLNCAKILSLYIITFFAPSSLDVFIFRFNVSHSLYFKISSWKVKLGYFNL